MDDVLQMGFLDDMINVGPLSYEGNVTFVLKINHVSNKAPTTNNC
jgi:hypothetical protein